MQSGVFFRRCACYVSIWAAWIRQMILLTCQTHGCGPSIDDHWTTAHTCRTTPSHRAPRGALERARACGHVDTICSRPSLVQLAISLPLHRPTSPFNVKMARILVVKSRFLAAQTFWGSQNMLCGCKQPPLGVQPGLLGAESKMAPLTAHEVRLPAKASQ